ncbi:uncharacterized protein LOC135809224 [Sycon ciliatum]|uniref:uncharacterized protein LOC135809224 n=1 Tax=Sycon ciliatum TaxID=27933 RepID=UPI0031F6DB52
MDLAPHQSVAVQLFCDRLRTLDVDTDVYSEYVVGILLDNEDSSDEEVIQEAADALSAVVQEDTARCLVQELHRNLNNTSLRARSNTENSSQEVNLPPDNADSTGQLLSDDHSGQDAPDPFSAQLPDGSDNDPETDQHQIGFDVNSDLFPGSSYVNEEPGDEYADADFAAALEDETALEEYLQDTDRQEWLSAESLQTEDSIFSLLNFHFSRSLTVDDSGSDDHQDTRRPCIFFMSGSCFRADCQFSHDMRNIPCRYFASGSCLKGADCLFLHQSPSLKTSETTARDENIVSLSADDFPSLTTEPRGTQAAGAHQQLQGSNSMWTEKVKTKHKAAAQPLSSTHSPPSSRLARMKGQAGAESIKWVDVGESLSELYADMRHQALAQGSLRNKCFQKAVESYKAGDKAAARRFSRQGRYHDEQMKRLNEKAAEEMFCTRNASTAKNVIDVHGLHVQEALDRLDTFLSQFTAHVHCSSASSGSSAASRAQYAYIITGTGHHSVQTRYKAKLQPVIVEELRRRQLQVFDCSKDGRGGLLRVTMPS